MIKKIRQSLFQNRSEKQTITKNIFWLSISESISRLIRAAIIIFAARELGAAEYGIFSYAVGIASFFTVFADIGLMQILTREVAQKPENKTQYFITSLWIKIALLFIMAVFVIVFFPYLSRLEAVQPLIPLIALLAIFDGIRELSLAFLRALEKMEFEALTTILMNIAITTSGFLVLTYTSSAKHLMLSYSLSAGVGTLIVTLILRNEFRAIMTHFRRDLVKPIINSSLPFAFLALMGAFMLNTDLVMLGWWRTTEEIGFYAAAQKIIMMLYLWPGILGEATFPAIARFINQNKNTEARMLLERAITITYLVAIPLAIGGTILAKSITLFIYGPEYLPATLSFQILVNTCLIVFPSILISNTILAYNRQKRALRFVALGSLSNIAFNGLLIPIYGVAGASVATIIAQLLSTIPMWQIAKKMNYFEILPHLGKIIPASIAMGIITLILDKSGTQVLLNIAISCGVYLCALYLFKEKLIGEAKKMLRALGSA